jgi:tRNA (mo5U34)-methyltransferase
VNAELRERIDAHFGWYHTIDLPDGSTTPGWTDLRALAAKVLPSLEGRRCLDIGTFDGFWAFAMEERGAAAVYALDVDDPGEKDLPPNTREQIREQRAQTPFEQGAGFALAHEARGSKAQRIVTRVKDLSVETLGGQPADFVLCGAILQHLRDPVGALERIRDVLSPTGELLMVETYSKALSGRRHGGRALAEFRPAVEGSLFTWWAPNKKALEAWGTCAGFGKPGPPLADEFAGHGKEDNTLALLFPRGA